MPLTVGTDGVNDEKSGIRLLMTRLASKLVMPLPNLAPAAPMALIKFSPCRLSPDMNPSNDLMARAGMEAKSGTWKPPLGKKKGAPDTGTGPTRHSAATHPTSKLANDSCIMCFFCCEAAEK